MKLGNDLSTNKPLFLTADDLRRHVYVLGRSGTGKSVLLEHLALSLIEQGYGVCLIDPHGDLVESVANSLPKARIQDTLYFEPYDLSHVIGFNPIADIEKDMRPLVAENVVASFSHAWGLSTQHTPRLLHILRNAIRLLLDNNACLIDLQRCLIDVQYRRKLLKRVTDDSVRLFWEDEFDAWNDRQRTEYIASLQNKIGIMAGSPPIRAVLSKSYLDPLAVMDTGQVLLVNLAKGKLGAESSALLGSLLVGAFAQAAYSRAENRKDFVLIIDEFQNFTTSAFTAILSEARKYGLALVAAHQYLSQLAPELRAAVIGTANTIIVFRCGSEDAPLLAGELDLEQPRRLKNLPNFQALTKTPGIPDARQLVTDPPQPPGKRLAAVRRRTRARS